MGIQGNQYRIGNIIEKSLKSGNGRKLTHPLTLSDLVNIHEGIGVFNYAEVPLTEEWLKRMGFEIHSDYSYRNFILPRNKFMISMWMSDEQPGGFEENRVCYWGEMYIPVRAVHHLQNLFYALTGSELEIKD